DINAGEEIDLRFWHWFSINSHDILYVKVQEETAPGEWGAWTDLNAFYRNSGGVWTYPLIDLSAYAGKKIRIGFVLDNSGSYTGTGAGWYLDDVSITTP
ncbi:hypothetical protein MNBD_NITROSPIRAE03-969, partial [hydrothermal vent metagenome]